MIDSLPSLQAHLVPIPLGYLANHVGPAACSSSSGTAHMLPVMRVQAGRANHAYWDRLLAPASLFLPTAEGTRHD
ncbi:hypothetical protein [Aeromonas cavernicola]|uniref:Uncharacterized protein n=1 Tax=Aeromonas cavernicola TaxID=1006623 RepID=A0A2H9U2N6_9GAMM|nr:hypothetical protein [Aeromonas cavernicola]PJG58317.1 hypothetical protein CUC53_13330 [Aeromonas cavernicola]